jgi:hypothetical protein
MSNKEELVKQLIAKTSQKSHGFKLFIWGIVLGVLNTIFDGLYNTIRLLSERGDLGERGKSILVFLEANFFILLVLWLLLWMVALILLVWGLSKWLNTRGEIEKIKLELETLK